MTQRKEIEQKAREDRNRIAAENKEMNDDIATSKMKGRLTTPEAALKYILAGDAYFTIRSLRTGTRYTFNVSKVEPSAKNDWRANMYFVKMLTGPENTSDYSYMGKLEKRTFDSRFRFELTKASFWPEKAINVVAFRWLVEQLTSGRLPSGIEVWHEGRCGRCGRPLTVPESIESGIGPVCAEKGL